MANESLPQTIHGVECYEAWRNEADCPHEAEETPPRDQFVQETPSRVRLMAEAIHAGRCLPRDQHASDEAYQHCARFYEDHAELALAALED